MDARLDPLAVLDLTLGDAHVLRSGGGRVNDPLIGALGVACGVFDIDRVVVLHHTGCGYANPRADILDAIEAATGHRPGDLDLPVIADPEAALRDDLAAIAGSPLVPDGLDVRGAIVDSGDGTIVHEAGAAG